MSPAESSSSRSGWSVSPALTGAAAVLTVSTVLLINARGLAFLLLAPAGLLWPVCFTLLAVGMVTATRAWRSTPFLGFLAYWLVLASWMPHALGVAPDEFLAEREMMAFQICGALSIAVLLLGRRAGLRWWRLGWVAALVFAGGLAVWELGTGDHLWVTPEKPFRFRGHVAVATYDNPNNFGIVLLSMLVALLAWHVVARTRRARTLLTGAAVLTGALVLTSQSRAAALGLVVILALEAARRSAAHPGWFTRAVSRRPRAVAATATVGVATLVSTFVVPPLAARNPVFRMMRDATLEETGRSDMMRVSLIRASLRYLRESNYLGAGAGSFEPILWNDPASGIEGRVNLHNAFFELLSQYGVLVAGVLFVLMAHLVWTAWRTRLSASLHPQVAAARTEMLGHLTVFVALGFTASSSLTEAVWWLILANACVSGAVVLDLTRSHPTSPSSTELRRLRAANDQAKESDRISGVDRISGGDRPHLEESWTVGGLAGDTYRR